MKEYYSMRAKEFERIYERDDPERQQQLAEIRKAMNTGLSGKRVLEVACGTGYWTAILAETAEHITATDFSPETLEMAKIKELDSNVVQFLQADAYALADIPGSFNAGLANFWFSHVPRKKISAFLQSFHARLGEGATVFMADNSYLPGVGGELIRMPMEEDTYKRRTLSDGTVHDILKNYYTDQELEKLFTPFAEDLDITVKSCFWWLSYKVRKS